MANTSKKAKDYVHEMSEVDRHAFNGRRHSFLSLIFAGVNEDSVLSGLQQNLCNKRISGVNIATGSEEYLAEVAMSIAGFMNTCHETRETGRHV